jgi:hypothetical protein
VDNVGQSGDKWGKLWTTCPRVGTAKTSNDITNLASNE